MKLMGLTIFIGIRHSDNLEYHDSFPTGCHNLCRLVVIPCAWRGGKHHQYIHPLELCCTSRGTELVSTLAEILLRTPSVSLEA